jgi:hypothetical protein
MGDFWFLYLEFLLSRPIGADVLVAFVGDGAAARRAFDQADLEEVRLVHFFNRAFFFR